MAKKLGTTIYYDWVAPLSLIPPNDFKKLVLALIKYERGEIDDNHLPTFESDVAKHSAMFMFPQMSRARVNAENGRRGGVSTANSSAGSTDGSTVGSTVGSCIETSTNTYTYTNTYTELPKGNKRGRPSAKANGNIFEEEFEKLWQIYPNKKGKAQALKHYIKHRKKGTSYEEVERGIRAYKKQIESQNTKSEFIKHGSTWFSQEAWRDEYSTSPVQSVQELSEDKSQLLKLINGEV